MMSHLVGWTAMGAAEVKDVEQDTVVLIRKANLVVVREDQVGGGLTQLLSRMSAGSRVEQERVLQRHHPVQHMLTLFFVV